jgi:hypothetical protein
MVGHQTPPRLRATIDLTIGGGDTPESSFGRVGSTLLGDDGRIYVADAQDQHIRVYSDAGRHLFTIGRRGSGPGEFTGVAAMEFAPDGALWVRDEGGNMRYQSFTVSATEARYRSTVRMLNHHADARQPLVFDARGNPVEIGRVSGQNASPYRVVRSTLDANARVVVADTTIEPPEDSLGVRLVPFSVGDSVRGMRYFYAPFGALPLVAHARSGEMARAVSSNYSVSWDMLDGRRLRVLRQSATGPEPTAAERRDAQEQQQSQREWAQRFRASVPDFRMPDRKPVLEALKFSRDGELWVARTPAAGRPREADVYDRNGRHVAIAEWSGFRLLDYWGSIVGRTAIAVTRDSLGEERVVRLRFR